MSNQTLEQELAARDRIYQPPSRRRRSWMYRPWNFSQSQVGNSPFAARSDYESEWA